MHHRDADKVYRGKAKWELHKNAMSYIEQILEATCHETTVVQSPPSKDEQGMFDTAKEARTNS